MSTRSSAKNLFPHLDNPELTIRRRSRIDPTLLNISEMAAEGNGDLSVPNLRTMEELCQPSLNGRGGPIAPIAIQATNFGLKNDTIQQVKNSCQFHVLPGVLKNSITSSFDTEIAALKAKMAKINKNLMRVLQVNQQVKEVTPNCETCGGPHSFNYCPATVGNTQNVYAAGAYQGNSYQTQRNRNLLSYRSNNYLGPPGFNQNQNPNNQNQNFHNQNRNQGNHNPQGNNQGRNQFFQGANQGQNQPPAYQASAYQALVYQAPIHQPQIPQPQVVTTNEFINFIKANDDILKNMQTNMTSLTNSNLELKNMFGQFMKTNTASSSGSRTLPGNTITNLKEDLKGITTRSGTAYQGPTIPTTASSSSPVVERETEVTKDTVHLTNNGSTKDVQPLVVPTESLILNSKPVISPSIEPLASPVSAPKPNLRPSIPYPSRLHDQKLRDKTNDQREKFFQIFKDLNFNISFAGALILMPKFGPTIKTLLTNKDKLSELARTPLNEHCSTVLLKKLPEKLGDPGKFLIPCDFPRMVECLALADLGASINLMPLYVWNKLFLPDFSPTCMTLELADRSISYPVGVAKYVFIKVGTFLFPADFVVVDFDADPRVPLILEIYFLKTGRALIDMFEEYSQEVLGFSDVIASSNPTPYYEPIVSTTSLTLTPFKTSDFLLKEVDAFLALEDDPTSPKVDQSYVDPDGDILLLEAFLNDDPSLPLPNQGNYLP
uniref:Reverse transcriptase domain-containing protein n=1 Tax=Tanacetum cinerariifolium TaxID=118510 RepID=A0A6L2LJE8_TANCI|nr:reverse transcriptase domain-containing protein [Tanacetum cinerariifolium]